jgi:hypothetical protein
MSVKKVTIKLAAVASLLLPAVALSQDASQDRTLIVNGQFTQVSVIDVKGRSYVDLEALANALNGSLSSSGTRVALSVNLGSAASSSAATTSSAAPPAAAPAPAANQGFSRGFLNAGIEQTSTLREWHTALATAIQNGIPITAGMLAP